MIKKSLFLIAVLVFLFFSLPFPDSLGDDNPISISTSESQFLFVGNSETKKIMIFERYGNYIKDITIDYGIKSLRDICSCPCGGYFLISDPISNKVISVDDTNGKIKHILTVDKPGSLAISKNKIRYEGVVSKKRNSILIYTENGKILREISGRGKFSEASAILIDVENNIWVCDSKGRNLLKLDLKGNVLENIKNINLSASVDIDSDKYGFIYTISMNKILLKFGKNGKLLESFDLNNTLISFPVSLTIDPVDSFIWIACEDKSILKFDLSLRLIDRITNVLEKEKKNVIYLKIGSRILDNVGFNAIILEAPPFIDKESNRSLVPIRAISEIFGANVFWNEKEGKVTIKFDTKVVNLIIGEKKANVNGKIYELDCPPTIVAGRTFVPVRFISEIFGATVNWIPAERRIIIVL